LQQEKSGKELPMAKPLTSSRRDAFSSSNANRDSARRGHGYRGYPRSGGEIHWGGGFSGIGTTRGPLGSSGILTPRTRHDAEYDGDDTLDA
jgi:hypothetical protein